MASTETAPAARTRSARLDAKTVLRDRLLATSWQQVALLEQVGQTEAQRALKPLLEAEAERAQEKLKPLTRWPTLAESSYATYTRGPNHVRLARLLDFIEAGDRILDIGFGPGYVTTVLMRTGLVESYWGFDLRQRFADSGYAGLEANGLPADKVTLEIGNVYDLTRKATAPHDPTLALVLEVLEHVPDAGKALSVLARALPAGRSVIFTVPMLGRLEGVLGHASLFGEARLREMCAAAGLTIQYVEPLHNSWTLVLATTSAKVPSRLIAAAAAPAPESAVPLRHDHVFADIPLDGAIRDYKPRGPGADGKPKIMVGGKGVAVELRRPADAGKDDEVTGGLAFAVDAPGILRVQIQYDDPAGIQEMVAEGYDGAKCVGAWRWRTSPKIPTPGSRLVHVFKPDGGGRFSVSEPVEPHRIERFEIRAVLRKGAKGAGFRLLRAAAAGGATAPAD